MKADKLIQLLEGVSTKDLENLIASKAKLDKLESKKTSLEKQLVSLTKQIDSIHSSLGRIAGKKPAARGKPKAKQAAKKAVRRTRRKRIAQPSLSSLVVELLKEKKKPIWYCLE